jgi:hypothetical protein
MQAKGWMEILANRLFAIVAGVAAGSLVTRFLMQKSEEETAQELNSSETDKAVTHVVVKTWDDVGAILMGIVEKHHGDIAEFDNFTFQQWYEKVRALPYIPDQPKAGQYDLDVFCRPSRTLAANPVCRDCDDKAILLACYCYRHGIPFRFVACSYKPENKVEHCILEVMLDGKWQECDSTYPEDSFPGWRSYWNKINLSEWPKPDSYRA